MTKISVDINDELNQRLRKYIWAMYDYKTHGKIKQVIQDALDEYLKEHGY